MSITFQCHHCHNEVTAPDAAGGKKGKCPFCGHTNEIPAEVDEEELIPLAPIDEEEERKAKEEARALYEQEQALLAETGGEPPIPLDQRKDLEGKDLHHFVANYCIHMADGKLPNAEQEVVQLRRYGVVGVQAVEDFISGTAMEPALDQIPRPVLQGLLKELRARVK